MKNIIYLHICCLNNWKEIVANIFAKVYDSGLYNLIDEIRCVILGEYDDFLQDPKIKIIYRDKNINLYETKIMELIFVHSQNEDFNILYLHSKGVSDHNQSLLQKSKIQDWTNLMLYYLIEKHKLCLDYLNMYDVVGVNLTGPPYPYPWHFSGNMWWSKSCHIRELGMVQNNNYNSPEFYVTSKANNSKYISLWNSDVNHYLINYDSNNYIDKIQHKIVINHIET